MRRTSLNVEVASYIVGSNEMVCLATGFMFSKNMKPVVHEILHLLSTSVAINTTIFFYTLNAESSS